jgi:hypothetical protein
MENKRKFRPNNDLEYEFSARVKSGLDHRPHLSNQWSSNIMTIGLQWLYFI